MAEAIATLDLTEDEKFKLLSSNSLPNSSNKLLLILSLNNKTVLSESIGIIFLTE